PRHVVPRERGADAPRRLADLDAGDQPWGVGQGRGRVGGEEAGEDEARGGPEDRAGLDAEALAVGGAVDDELAGVGVEGDDAGAEVEAVAESGALEHAADEARVALGRGEEEAAAGVFEAAGEEVVQAGEGRGL